MSRPKVPPIDWRGQFEQLQPYLAHKGGVVHIQTKKESPISAFTKVLRSKMEYDAWDRKWVTVQIDGANSATRYLSDMIYQIERTLGLQTPVDQIPPISISLASGIQAGGEVQIERNVINVDGERLGVRESLQYRVNQIIQWLDESSRQRRLGIIFYESHHADINELAAFRTVLWNSALEELTEKGLLLIDISIEGWVHDSWPPEPDLVFDLPDRYDKESGKEAVDDLVAILLQEGKVATEKEARTFAATMVANNERPRDLYANLSAVIAKVEALI
jgi:hypothetical protein